MTYVVGIIGAALLFGVFAMLRPSETGCTGHCAGCTRDGTCAKGSNVLDEETRNFE